MCLFFFKFCDEGGNQKYHVTDFDPIWIEKFLYLPKILLHSLQTTFSFILFANLKCKQMSFFIKLNCKKKNGILKSVTFLKSPLFFQPDGALNLLTELFLIDKKKKSACNVSFCRNYCQFKQWVKQMTLTLLSWLNYVCHGLFLSEQAAQIRSGAAWHLYAKSIR